MSGAVRAVFFAVHCGAMEALTLEQQAEVQVYLETGDSEPMSGAWRGGTILDALIRAKKAFANALVAEVRRRTAGRAPPTAMPKVDLVELTRQKVGPMVRGLFTAKEQDTVLELLARSVVFLRPENIGDVLEGQSFPGTAWDLANLYLGSAGAELLGPDAPRLVGLSEETTCYVSPSYFTEDDPFADFMVHEAAHIFHNAKRNTAGLRETRTREWLLDIEYRKRETFAYSCEAYARIVDRAGGPAERRELADEFAKRLRISDERVDAAEVAAIVRAAASDRNGWKIILGHCAPTKQRRAPLKVTGDAR